MRRVVLWLCGGHRKRVSEMRVCMRKRKPVARKRPRRPAIDSISGSYPQVSQGSRGAEPQCAAIPIAVHGCDCPHVAPSRPYARPLLAADAGCPRGSDLGASAHEGQALVGPREPALEGAPADCGSNMYQ